jgi:hypothetical protein
MKKGSRDARSTTVAKVAFVAGRRRMVVGRGKRE